MPAYHKVNRGTSNKNCDLHHFFFFWKICIGFIENRVSRSADAGDTLDTLKPIWKLCAPTRAVYAYDFSMWYMSPNNRCIGMSPMVSLKKSLSMVACRTARRFGNMSKSRPKRVGCLEYRPRT